MRVHVFLAKPMRSSVDSLIVTNHGTKDLSGVLPPPPPATLCLPHVSLSLSLSLSLFRSLSLSLSFFLAAQESKDGRRGEARGHGRKHGSQNRPAPENGAARRGFSAATLGGSVPGIPDRYGRLCLAVPDPTRGCTAPAVRVYMPQCP